jgi:hypothetical protein
VSGICSTTQQLCIKKTELKLEEVKPTNLLHSTLNRLHSIFIYIISLLGGGPLIQKKPWRASWNIRYNSRPPHKRGYTWKWKASWNIMKAGNVISLRVMACSWTIISPLKNIIFHNLIHNQSESDRYDKRLKDIKLIVIWSNM